MEKEIDDAINRIPFDMTNVLVECEKHISALLEDRERWRSLMVNYKPPHLMRLFTQVGKVRINLHYFFAASTDVLEECDVTDVTAYDVGYNENLYHPHGWASCMRILSGRYEQWLGFATGRGIDMVPQKTLHLVHNTGDTYAMNHPWLWHQVIPTNQEPVLTLMVTYIPPNWDQEAPLSTQPLRSLTEQEAEFMFQTFKAIYKS